MKIQSSFAVWLKTSGDGRIDTHWYTRNPRTYQTCFHGSPHIFIQVFTCVNGVPVTEKIYPIVLEIQWGQCRRHAYTIHKRAPNIHKRALYLGERALSIHNRAPNIHKRAPNIHKRALHLGERALSVHQRAPNILKRALYLQDMFVSFAKINGCFSKI